MVTRPALMIFLMLIGPALQTVLLGTATLGFVAGAIGTFAVLRRQSLMGDAVSHAALPGVVLAFLLVGRQPLALLAGAIVAGLIAMRVVSAITNHSRVPFDSALAGALAVFFGIGLVFLVRAQRQGAAGVDRYLFGQAATLLVSDVWRIVVVGSVALVLVGLFWKQFQLLSFDREFAAGLGWRIGFWDSLLTGLIVVAICIGMEAVGVVLMSSLVVAPTAAARPWTNRLGRLTVLSGLFGALSSVVGTVLSHVLSDPSHNISVPTGPTIVLCATALVGLSLATRWLIDRAHQKAVTHSPVAS